MMNPISTVSRRPAPALPPPWCEGEAWRAPRPPAWSAPQVAWHDETPAARPTLADLVAGGDTAARLRAHLSGSYAALHGRLARRFGCADLARECLHDTWLRLARPVAGEVRQADAYVFRMACHLAIDRLRAQASWLSLDDPDAGLPEPIDESPGPQTVAEGRSALMALAQIMEGLPRRQRAVLIALRVEGRSRGDAAEWLGMSLRSVDTALRQALRHCEKAAAQAR
ncbi:RNA polymerase sigma factor [Achromobacter sp. UMC46]|uniref:RNA polymerase sigma factor n=1 Tax=Achromobacter sp. UMC46 TaxID=1862319 RepID=UPI001603075B|nr:RNA polymerase sigma factor [Achromobacter sp. UMC46]